MRHTENKLQVSKRREHTESAAVISLSKGCRGLLQSRLSPPDSNKASAGAATVLLKAFCLFGAPSFILAPNQVGSVSPTGQAPCQIDCQQDWMHQSLTIVIRSCSEIKEITAVCSHRFIHAMSDYALVTKCCFDESHPTVQVDSVHKADNRELYNLLLAKGWKLVSIVLHGNVAKLLQVNYIRPCGIKEGQTGESKRKIRNNMLKIWTLSYKYASFLLALLPDCPFNYL